jgi:hypothetical protein
VEIAGRDFGLGDSPDHVQFPLELILRHALGGAQEHLFDIRLGDARLASDGVHVERRIAPSENDQAFLPRDALDHAFAQ